MARIVAGQTAILPALATPRGKKNSNLFRLLSGVATIATTFEKVRENGHKKSFPK